MPITLVNFIWLVFGNCCQWVATQNPTGPGIWVVTNIEPYYFGVKILLSFYVLITKDWGENTQISDAEWLEF